MKTALKGVWLRWRGVAQPQERAKTAPPIYLRGIVPGMLAVLLALSLASCDNGNKANVSPFPSPAPATTDPLFSLQWYLKNTGQTAYADTPGVAGQDINLGSSTETGLGVKVAVVDSGLEIAHEDLAPNVIAVAGATSCNFVASASFGGSTCSVTDPTNTVTSGDHGTSVAGLIAARMNNGIGLRGVAGLASLVGFNLISSNQTAAMYTAALGGTGWSSGVYVFNQSYGVGAGGGGFQSPSPVDPTVKAQYIYGVTSLRGGLGAVYVKSAGNGFSIGPDYAATSSGCVSSLSCQNTSMDPFNAEPWNIVVGAMNAAGVRSSYSTAGSAIWVSAPGGEFGASNSTVSCGGAPCTGALIEPAMVTTDQSGCGSGYAVNFFDVTNHLTINPFNLGQTPDNANCNYTSTFNGTSSAAPVTSGVVALLLQANPSLTWRDVKHILAKTSTKVDPNIAAVDLTLGDGTYVAEPAWKTNAAGYPFHNWYGFGRVNVTAALSMAKSGYSSLPALSNGATGYFFSCTGCSGAIPDNSVTGVNGTFGVSGAPSFVEAVQLTISLTHTYLGDVGIELTSPGGTRSVLLPPNNGYGAYPAGFSSTVLLSNAFYGEGSTGTWTVKVVDGMALDTGTLSSASLKIFGH